MRQVGAIHLLLGPVGAGKSTLAQRLCEAHGAVAFDLDDWMVRLFAPDRPAAPDALVPWYTERAERCVEMIWVVAQDVARTGTDVVLELGLVRALPRRAFLAQLDRSPFDVTLHLVDAPRERRRERVARRNTTRGSTFSMAVSPEVFEMASDLWEPPTQRELAGRRVVHVDNGAER